jgi:GABA permease
MPVRMWGYPYLTWAVVIVIPVMLVYMLFDADQRTNILATAVIAIVVVALGVFTTRGRSGGDVHTGHTGAQRGDGV